MSDIPTWHERAMRHPDHQTGMVSEGMIRARMGEEISDLRAEVERLRAKNERLRDVSMQAVRVLVRAFDRIHQLPRTSDTELATAIDTINGKLRDAALEGKQ